MLKISFWTTSLPKPSLFATPSIPTYQNHQHGHTSPSFEALTQVHKNRRWSSLPPRPDLGGTHILSQTCATPTTPPCPPTLHPNNIPNLKPYRYRYGYLFFLLQFVFDHREIFCDICVMALDDNHHATHFCDNLLYHRSPPVMSSATKSSLFASTVWGLKWLWTSAPPTQNLFDGMLMRGRFVVVEAIFITSLIGINSTWSLSNL